VRELYAVSPAFTLVTKEPPATGRPKDWHGAIGRFALAAEVAPTKARVGDPLTLTVTVTGSGNLADLAPPDLGAEPAFAAGFKVYDATAQTKGGARVFAWGLRPKSAGVKEVPPVPFSWFDVQREQYASAATEAVPIEVSEAERLDASEVVAERGATPA